MSGDDFEVQNEGVQETRPEGQEAQVEDLDVTAPEAEDVKGGALNAYLNLTGQKQGDIKPPPTQP